MQKAKGTYDVYGEDGRKIKYLVNLLNVMMDNYNYEYVRTPIFESSELFKRGVGETTDIVSKETYDFLDRGSREMTLRPEGTAGVVRSYLENKMFGDVIQPKKLWYYGPMYRYERPQSGRFREFYQFGVEAFGSNSPALDAEVISIPVNFYKLIGLKGIKVNINSLGDTESRDAYRVALKDYFRPHLDELCSDCKVRFDKNPLRILDCKVDADKDIMKNAPKMVDYLNDESVAHFEAVKRCLDEMDIEYNENPNLVRGLDYYTHTVFEVEASVEGFGAQNVLCGGGRYNNLVNEIGSKDIPGVGFALGFERLLLALEAENIKLFEDKKLDVFVIPMGTIEKSINLCNYLRLNGFKTDTDYLDKNIKYNFKQSERLNAEFVIILGETEVDSKVLTLKDKAKNEYKVKLEDLVEFLDKRLNDEED